ncbi:MAG: ribonuclease E activity regulator RraA [Caldilineaceae bacterium]
MPISTADLCDSHEHLVQVADPVLHDYGGLTAFSGPMTTVMVMDDNTSVRELLEADGHGRVLVVDGGGSLRCALVGDRLAQTAADNGWAGIVVNGCVRDVSSLAEIPLGIKALASMPWRSAKQGPGLVDVPVRFAGITFLPGHYLYADDDGVIVAPMALE